MHHSESDYPRCSYVENTPVFMRFSNITPTVQAILKQQQLAKIIESNHRPVLNLHVENLTCITI